MTAASAHAIFGKCIIEAPHEPETLGLIANMIYVAMVVVGYGIAVVMHASAGVATSAQATAYAWEAHYLSACALTRLGIFSDSPSICGDSDLRNLY